MAMKTRVISAMLRSALEINHYLSLRILCSINRALFQGVHIMVVVKNSLHNCVCSVLPKSVINLLPVITV